MTKAEFARYVARLGAHLANETAGLAQGMWNPHFCGADASADVDGFLRTMRSRLDYLQKLNEEPLGGGHV